MSSVNQLPGDVTNWVIAKFQVKRLVSEHFHGTGEWEDVTLQGLLNCEDNLVLFLDRGNAFDVEYYTRGGTLQWELVRPLMI
jgi:hypothetical protein